MKQLQQAPEAVGTRRDVRSFRLRLFHDRCRAWAVRHSRSTAPQCRYYRPRPIRSHASSCCKSSNDTNARPSRKCLPRYAHLPFVDQYFDLGSKKGLRSSTKPFMFYKTQTLQKIRNCSLNNALGHCDFRQRRLRTNDFFHRTMGANLIAPLRRTRRHASNADISDDLMINPNW